MNQKVSDGTWRVIVILGTAILLAMTFYHFFIVVDTSEVVKKDDVPEAAPTDLVSYADDSGVTENAITSAVVANNNFALKLYKNMVAQNGDKNVFFSPYSISTALAMTYEGANGETAEEIAMVFGFDREASIRRPAMARLYNLLNKTDSQYTLSTANALWVQQNYTLLPEYTDTVSRYYVGNASNVDFINNTEESREMINDWVAERTNEKITNLLASGTVGPLTRLVLTNTIYFKGDWLSQFDVNLTREESFRVTETETVPVPMMTRSGEEVEYPYAETGDVQVIELPYKGEELSMIAILPKDDGVTSPEILVQNLEQQISVENISAWQQLLQERRVDVFLPRFKMEIEYNLNDPLRTLGMSSAFSDDADFSGMNGTRELSIGLVAHKAFVEVNEEGTEAAAATAVVITKTSMLIDPVPVFKADRPFIFMISEKSTGAILFMGRVMNPVQG
jgi:serpin B